MRSHALSTPSRLCVRGVFCEPAFPSACCLPSTPSAGGRSSPLGSLGFTWLSPAFPPSCPFRSAMVPVSVSPVFCSEASSVLRSSQTPCSVHRWLQSLDFPSRPSAPSASGGTQGLPVLAHDASTHARGLLVDRARSDRTSPILVQPVLPSAPDTDSAPGSKTPFRGSIPGLRVPLSTLRERPHSRLHMTRGPRGWLALRSANSSFATSCRFIPALLCGRDAGFPAPPAQIPARGITALGSCLRSEGKGVRPARDARCGGWGGSAERFGAFASK